MVPAWSLAVAFVAGIAAGVVIGRVLTGRGRPAEAVAPAAQAEAAPAAVEAAPAAVEVSSDRAPESAAVASEEGAEHEDPAAAVDDVVAELERRVKGRRTDGEADGAAGSRRAGRE